MSNKTARCIICRMRSGTHIVLQPSGNARGLVCDHCYQAMPDAEKYAGRTDQPQAIHNAG